MIYILIPSYNDSQNFENLLKNLKKHLKLPFQLLIVDDGSTDNTKQITKKLSSKYPVKRIGYKRNRGPGFAYRFGFDFLISKLKLGDLVITMEADNTSDYKILNHMIEKSGNYDIVLASPFMGGGGFLGVSKTRVFLSSVANRIDGMVFGIKKVTVYSSFYRLHRADILKKAKKIYGNNLIKSDGFSVFVELLVKFKKLDARIIELPAIVDWTKKKGKSKLKISKSLRSHLNLYRDYYSGKYNIK